MEEPTRNLVQRLEYWDGNNFYGIGNILKKYAGLPNFIPLNFTIQHGVVPFSIFGSLDDCTVNTDFYLLKDSNAVFLMFNDEYLSMFHDRGVRNVKAIGAPIIYINEFAERCRGREKRGTIAFPNHSTHYIDVVANHDRYASMLKALPDKFHPIKICMYYLDIKRGYDKPYREKGFDIICNGTLWSQNFLYNFTSNVSPFKYGTSNDNASSAIFYSIYLGLKWFSYGPAPTKYILEDSYAGKKQYEKELAIVQSAELYRFAIDRCEDYGYQKEISDRELGVKFKISKTKMRRMILGALTPDFLKKYVWTVLPRFKSGRLLLKGYRFFRTIC